jgi:hypothetical protein
VSLGGEPTWGGVAAPASGSAAERATESEDGAVRTEPGPVVPSGGRLEDLEAEVYAARELNGDELAQARGLLADARKGMSDPTYRRALELARDSVLLSVEECLSGALAMEWDPLPRPEFTLAAIEAAVAEQERRSSSV